jgi:hypothetical protein
MGEEGGERGGGSGGAVTRYGERERLGQGGGGRGKVGGGGLGGDRGRRCGGGGMATATAGKYTFNLIVDTWHNLTTDINRLSKKNIHTTVQSVHQLLHCN